MQQRTRRLLSVFAALFLFWNWVAASGHSDSSAIRFIQNNGQWEPQVLFAADIPMGRVFLEKDRLTYAFCDVSNLHEQMFHNPPGKAVDSTIDCHAFSVKFVGLPSAETILGEKSVPEYHNYFHGADPKKWASEVPLFKQVRYHNLYPGIDFVIYTHGLGLKYDFVVQPGANAGQVRLAYEGLEELGIDAGQLKMVTSINEIREDRPVAFQNDQALPCNFSLEGNELGFYFPEGYDGKSELIIDPTLVFSTFTGSTANNFGFSATYDASGNLYAGGIAYGQGYPISLGAYQTSFHGSFDVSITKFSTIGSMLYSTYLGGSNPDQPHSMVVDVFGNLFVFGMTRSNDFPTTASRYDGTLSGASDIYVSKLSPNGASLLASTYVGGDGLDAFNIDNTYAQNSIKYNYGDDARGEIVTDNFGNIYIASCTRSGNFPTTPGAFRPQISSTQDGVVFKMNPALTQLVWSTHLGGSGDDAAYSLKLDANQAVYVTGGTASPNFPTTQGTISPNRPGGIDGFLTHINPQGTGLVSSTYIGTALYDQCYFVEIDQDGDVYIVGQTEGNFLRTPGVWSSGTSGQFIQKFDPDLSIIHYSTVFGNGNGVSISPTAFLVDVCEYVYVSGWGGATNFQGNTLGLPTTPNAIQQSTDGSDLYLIVLQDDAVGLNFATFMGGSQSNEHVDGGTSRFSKHAEVYQAVCAGCWNNSDFPTTPGAYSPTNNAGQGGCNLACFKMDLELEGIVADFQPVPALGGCAPHSVQFQNQSTGGVSFTWNFGDPGSGGANVASTYNASHTFQNPGTYLVMLIVSDPNSCNGLDTSYRTINVYPYPVLVLTPDTSFCEGQGITLQASGGLDFQWSPAIGLSSTNTGTTFANPTTSQTYNVITTNPGGCADTGQVTISILPVPIANAGTGGWICPGDSVQLSASGGTFYNWNNAGSLSNNAIPNPFAFPTQTTLYTVTATALNGCTDTDTVTVRVSAVLAQPGPDIDLCIGDGIPLNASGGGTYFWQPPTGLSAINIANPFANPTVTTTYALTVTDGFGCSHTDSLRITVHPLPVIDVGPDFVMCENDTVQLTATGAATYAWAPPTGLSNPNSGNPLTYPSADITYIVTGTDIYGCRDQDTLTIDVMPAPTAQAWGGSVICEDSSLQVFASGGNAYMWAPANAFNDPQLPNPIVTLTQTTNLIVTVFGTNGCRDWDTVFVPVTPTPVAQILGPDLICQNEMTFLLGTGGEVLLWSTGESTPKIAASPDLSTLYTLTVWVDDCPSVPDSLVLVVDTIIPIADFFADPDSGSLPFSTTFFNQSQNGGSWIWDFGDGGGSNIFSPSHEYQDTGRFDVTLIAVSATGCRDTAVQRVIVGADFTIYVPNAFTPNGDGLNDFFFVKWIGVKEFHVMLFDRWGMMIYESFDPDFQWDGSLHAKGVQEGVYTYVIEARGYLSEKMKRAGTVTLLR